jgi:hypothetical protein
MRTKRLRDHAYSNALWCALRAANSQRKAFGRLPSMHRQVLSHKLSDDRIESFDEFVIGKLLFGYPRADVKL